MNCVIFYIIGCGFCNQGLAYEAHYSVVWRFIAGAPALVTNIFNDVIIPGSMVYGLLYRPRNNIEYLASSLKPRLIYDWIIVNNQLAPTLPGSAVNHADSMSASKARG